MILRVSLCNGKLFACRNESVFQNAASCVKGVGGEREK